MCRKLSDSDRYEKKKLNFTRTCHTVSYNSDEEKKWKLKADEIDKEIESYGKTDLIKRGGPICSTLDAILNKNKVAHKHTMDVVL